MPNHIYALIRIGDLRGFGVDKAPRLSIINDIWILSAQPIIFTKWGDNAILCGTVSMCIYAKPTPLLRKTMESRHTGKEQRTEFCRS